MDWKQGEKHRNGIKTIQIYVTKEDYEIIKQAKGNRTWLEFLDMHPLVKKLIKKRGKK